MHRQHQPIPARGLRPSERQDDLRCVLDAGWVQLDDLHPQERRRAARFYADRAPGHQYLAGVQHAAQAVCERWTGNRPHPMGSSYAGTALDSSDIDLYAPMPNRCVGLGDLRELLAGRAAYRKTRPGPTGEDRHLFSYTEGATRIDLNFVPPSDYRLALTVVQEIAAGLTTEDRIAHTWIKHLLHEQSEEEAYDHWKTTMRLRTSPTLRALMASGGVGRIAAIQQTASSRGCS
ncbi:hypothetical protein [Streptacidiphilus anmyonensis]|uniref:hypothetical protein n=1 Tax=Streptacidiphilus anmyonensis TaxID=405782 RepID=UPI0005A872B4|nr:hypothetical protein [Streptacidiphilus anmyonensis]